MIKPDKTSTQAWSLQQLSGCIGKLLQQLLKSGYLPRAIDKIVT